MSKKTIIIICVCVVLIPVLLIGTFVGISLIGTGVMLYGNASSIAESTAGAIDTLGRDAFNNQFTIYEGDASRVSTVKGLINKIITNNENAPDCKIKIEYKSKSGMEDVIASESKTKLNEIVELLETGKTYKVKISDYTKDGIVSLITITEN